MKIIQIPAMNLIFSYFSILVFLFGVFPSNGKESNNKETIYIPGVCTMEAPAVIVSVGEISKLVGKNLSNEQWKKLGLTTGSVSTEELKKIMTSYDGRQKMIFQPLDQFLNKAPSRGVNYRYFSMGIQVGYDEILNDGQSELKNMPQEFQEQLALITEENLRKEGARIGMELISFKSLGVQKINGVYVLRHVYRRKTDRSEYPNCVNIITIPGNGKFCTITITASENPESIWFQSLDEMISSFNFDIFLNKNTEVPTPRHTVIDDLLSRSKEIKDAMKDIDKIPEDWTKYNVKGVCSVMVPRHIISIFDEVKDVMGNDEDSLGTIPLNGNKEIKKLFREKMDDCIIEFLVDKDFLFKRGLDQIKSYININISSVDQVDEWSRAWKTETPNITNRELEKLDSLMDAAIKDNTGCLNSLFSKKMQLDSIAPFERMNYDGMLMLRKKYHFHFAESKLVKISVDALFVKRGEKIITINITYLDHPSNENIKYIDKIVGSIDFSPLLKKS